VRASSREKGNRKFQEEKKMSNYEKAKVPMFDGDEENFDQWEIQWKAFTQVENLVSTLGKQLDADMPESVLAFNKTEKAGTTSKEAKVAVKANRQGMAYLALALKPMELLHLLTREVTTESPEGEAWNVMKQVQDIYRPNDVQSIAEGRFKLASIRMGADENPSILFCKLATLEHAYSNTQGRLTNNNMIGAIFAIAPEKYRATLSVTVGNHGAALQPSHLEAAMRKIWRQSGGSKGLSTAKRGTKIVLTAFTGICYMCKGKGHRATHCPNKEAKGGSKSGKGTFKGDKAKRFNGNCNHCGKQGHQKTDCWELPENAAKRPASYLARNEQANVHVDSSRGGGIEFVLCAIDSHPVYLNTDFTEEASKDEAPKGVEEAELGLVNLLFPDAVQLLEDPCIWIGDSPATVHMTPHAVGMVPNKDDKMKGLAITVGNGAQEMTAMNGTIKGQMFNKNGIGVGMAILNDVAYSPQMKYNLCSL